MAESKKARRARAVRELKAKEKKAPTPVESKKSDVKKQAAAKPIKGQKEAKAIVKVLTDATEFTYAPVDEDGEKKKRPERPRILEGLMAKEVEDRLFDALYIGSYVETACAYAGISKNTYYDWLRRGERERMRLLEGKPVPDGVDKDYASREAIYVKFSDAMERAIASADIRDLTLLARAGQKGVWQVPAWRQERKHPDKWGRQRVEITGAEGVPLDMAPKMVVVNVVRRNPDGTTTINGQSDDYHAGKVQNGG